MIVTDKKYYMDDKLIGKLDLMVKRCSGIHKLDNWIVVDGDEGYGKSTMSFLCAYYMAEKLGREFTTKQIFFDPDKFIEYGTKTNEQVMVLDESVFGGLSGDAMTKIGKKLIKFAMVIRKKRHCIFLNIPKFFKLNEYLMVDRSICLIHVYARGGTQLGRFVYFSNTQKEKLFWEYKRKRARKYKTFYTLRGSFPDALKKVIDEKEYDKKKDAAILSFGAGEESRKDSKQELFKKLFELNKEKGIKVLGKEYAKLLNVCEDTITAYKKGCRDKSKFESPNIIQ